ncbi:hypothetical protein GLOIN_2v1518558 [Rhizophagus irregularis DAOM 181602=DAOM 197198]|uniref:Uncharacterized protein n=1 Tax=Rhizophagus irregularis (strain DAOM 181602 / DAOM 197198 / MUCL 43194) TaxID=747089 RepID=A0A2P4QS23_RHIID|nr:hypothetical protein GLOIN_2v1518558 [Rhizophagus irregularis DAOM 181602=DAOM 197198]POG80447.1 hypothetical protein GLOIN_2v1518558 [Rhizophagus irregularis DAOM 181602=DAOM 197198]GET50195.1 hypothetical protein GLOIN_2v1518558 [Rhizophagus irregularis DAOM 181602=DAOM 197198]|eukprot:XP_025187313.1 hypothetical protein GLOIN_2v1518558 [Rhizophagus irregularis DAOM 181602=DAOM 197198]
MIKSANRIPSCATYLVNYNNNVMIFCEVRHCEFIGTILLSELTFQNLYELHMGGFDSLDQVGHIYADHFCQETCIDCIPCINTLIKANKKNVKDELHNFCV